MPIGPGSRVGPYEVVAPLGAGGMGEVYRARDTRLNRDVALKILPDVFASDPERLARFEREAQALAALNHPHIATIHGIEETDPSTGSGQAARALVLELVEGESLAALLAKGPLPVDEAVRIARQIADALEAAHEHGIVHRDLKPANIQITPDGSVKVLDFGLAKLTGTQESMSGSTSLSMSPTMTSPAVLTAATVLLGTAGYMSPEQARGKPSDKRADISAFGVVLYEMLTGRRAFEGESVTEVAGAVIHKDPDWGSLPPGTAPTIRMIVRRCLQKDPKQRFRDMGDVRLALDGAFTTESAVPAVAHELPKPGKRALAFSVAAAILLATATGTSVWMFSRGDSTAAAAPVRFDVTPVAAEAMTPLLAVSPDGRMLAFIALDDDGAPRLWIYELQSGEGRILVPAEVVRTPPFWSPDSRYLAFSAGGRLKKVDVTGGPAESLADLPNFAGGTWGRNDVLLYSTVTGIFRVAASGGDPVAVTTVDADRDESAHVLPSFLPDGRHFLYLRFGSADHPNGIYIGATDTEPAAQDLTRVLATDAGAVYAPSLSGNGHIVFVRDGLLMAQPFDDRERATIGTPAPITTERVEISNNVLASVSASPGVLVYRRSGALSGRMTLVDRTGNGTPIPGVTVDRADNPRLSPDGTRLALVTGGDLWVYHLDGRPPIRLTFSDEQVYSPIWTPDGRRIVYERGGSGDETIFSIAADGSAREPQASAPDGHFHPHGWTTDGQLVAARVVPPAIDIVRLQPDPEATVEEIVATPAAEGFAASVSPDGRWLAYSADPTGRTEIWIRPLAGGAAVRVSPNGGNEPAWSKDGRELFYLEDRKMMAVSLATGAELRFEPPVELFTMPIIPSEQPPSYDVMPKGGFVMMSSDEAAQIPISVILNWTELLGDRSATH